MPDCASFDILCMDLKSREHREVSGIYKFKNYKFSYTLFDIIRNKSLLCPLKGNSHIE